MSNFRQPFSQFMNEQRYSTIDTRKIHQSQIGLHSHGLNNIVNLPLVQGNVQYLAPHIVQRTDYRSFQQKSNNNPTNRNSDSNTLKLLSKRRWKSIGRRNCENKAFTFSVVSYNVLAQDLLNGHKYLYREHCNKDLDWCQRWKNVYNEIKTLNADILCLQEVQKSHLPTHFQELQKLGYQGLYKKRTGIRCDGCAIYFKTNRIHLIEYEMVEFYQPNVSVLNRDNVAIIAKFSPKQSPEIQFIVATTHLLYNPNREDVRVAQTQLLLTEVERLSFCGKGQYCPIIITGDFNSTPDSDVYQLITKGCLKYSHLVDKRMQRSDSSSQSNVLMPRNLEVTDTCQHASLLKKRENDMAPSRPEEACLIKLHNSDKTLTKITSETIYNPEWFSSGTLKHLFALKSVYLHGKPNNREGTTFQDEWITVDYIFYSGKKDKEGQKVQDHKLKLEAVYTLPLTSDLGSIRIPNRLIGSDHLSLAAKFTLKF
ncbi:hypothetical protein ABEB36_000448 [Hypothenemus hampei]|uniref:Endonuclease/exonuclease/phosphatase domain-containing protein n=1 Tax=Hypothenemus hampei TaxID=57062 RepID=A0ABD1FBS2_HYPHA